MADLIFGPPDDKAAPPSTAVQPTPPPAERQDVFSAPDTLPPKTVAPRSERKLLDNAPDNSDSFLSGTAKNTAATVGHGLSHVPGMAGDTVDMALRVAASATAKMPWEDRSREQIEQAWRTSLANSAQARRGDLEKQLEQPGLSDYDKNVIKRHIARISANPEGTPPTGEQIYKKAVEPTLGDYTPTSMPGRFGRAVGETVIPSVLAPGMSTGKAAVAGTGAGVAGQGAAELGVTDPLALAAISLVGAGTPSVYTGARKGILGKNAAEQQGVSDKIVKDYLEHPETKLAGMLDNVSANAKPEDVSAAVQRHLDQLNATADAAPQPVGSHPEVAGANLADAAQTQHDTHMEAYKALKKSIDPEGNMQAWAGDLNEAAATKLKEGESRQYKTKLGPVAIEYLEMAAKMKDVMPLNDLIDFDQNITQGMKQTHDTVPADYGVLSELKGQVKDAMNKALENQHKAEQVRTRNGTLNPEDTVASRFQRQRDTWLDARKKATASEGDAAGVGSADTRAAGSVPPVHGVGPEDGSGASAPTRARSGVEGSGDAGGAAGVPGGEASFEPVTPEAAQRLALSNDYYGKIKDTFGKGVVGKALDTDFGGQSKMLNADIAQKAFVPGPKGAETAQMWLAASGPEGLTALKDIANGRLQNELKGKPLDQKALDAFKEKHKDALRAIDEADKQANPGQNRPFSDSFNDTAEAQRNVHEFENNAAAKVLGKEPGDIINHVGKLMQSGDSTAIRQLMEQVKTMPDGEAAVAGIQRSAAQAFKNDLETRGPIGLLKAFKERRNTLDAVFDPASVKAMADQLEKLEKSSSVQTIISRATGAPVSGRAIQLGDQLKAAIGKDASEGQHTIGQVFWLEAMEHGAKGNFPGVAAAIGLGLARKMAGKYGETRRAAAGANIAKLVSDGLTNPEIGKLMSERATTAAGQPNSLAFDALAKIMATSESAEGSQQRQGHASGGAVFDHKAAAKHMVGLVDKVRKRDTERTKPLLQAHDTTIANALALANRSI